MSPIKEIKIPEITEDLAYLCGVLTGDGYMKRRYDKHEYFVNFVLEILWMKWTITTK